MKWERATAHALHGASWAWTSHTVTVAEVLNSLCWHVYQNRPTAWIGVVGRVKEGIMRARYVMAIVSVTAFTFATVVTSVIAVTTVTSGWTPTPDSAAKAIQPHPQHLLF